MPKKPRQSISVEHRVANAREILSQFRQNNNRRAVLTLGFDIVTYLAFCLLGTISRVLIVKIACGIATGIFIARLFVLAHDACHQSLTSNHLLNRWLGRISFLPSLTPYSSWELAHNSIHHVFNNWSQKDYVWAPLSKIEFDALPKWRQTIERVYRSPFGQGLYYLIEIWWKRLFFPKKSCVDIRWAYQRDSTLVTLFAVAWIGFSTFVAKLTGQSVLLQFLTSQLLAFMVWNGLMGFTVFVHHTHPNVEWFLDRNEWRASQAQLQNSIHVAFTVPFDSFFHHIYKHTAHHLDVRIPFYHLFEAQQQIEATYPKYVAFEQLTVNKFFDVARVCKLYDYKTHCWLDFNGRITARTKLTQSGI